MVKEGRTIDAKVGPGLGAWVRGQDFPAGMWRGSKRVPDALCLTDPTEEEDKAQFKSPNGVPRGLGDGLPGAQTPNSLHQVLEMGEMGSWRDQKQEREQVREGQCLIS